MCYKGHLPMLLLLGVWAAIAQTHAYSTSRQVLSVDGFRACARNISGVKMIYKGDPSYEKTRQIFHNLRVQPNRNPLAFGLPASPKDAAMLLQCATSNALLVSVRGGGHNYEGLCLVNNGLVIDTSLMTGIQFGKRGATNVVTVGAGQRTGPINHQLWTRGFIVPTGVCDSVGIGGVTLGGGIGPQVRKAGLVADSLVEAQMVTAAGQIVTVNAASNPDLFFALRGGGGNFGVVTSLTYRLTSPAKTASVLRVWWPNTLPNIKAVLTALFKWNAYTLAPEFSYVELYVGKGSKSPRLLIYYWGPKSDLQKLYDTSPIFKAGTGVTIDLLTEMPFGDFLALVMNWSKPIPLNKLTLPNVIAGMLIGRPSFRSSSSFLSTGLDAAAIDKVANLVFTKVKNAWIQFHPLGGAYSQVGVSDTAFPHRQAQYQLQIKIYEDNMAWVRSVQSALGPAATGLQYLNYIDTNTADPWSTYFGPNAARLKAIKQKWDPQGVFNVLTQR